MDTLVDRKTQLGLGFATHPDAFQCGREAAQAAKNQLPAGAIDLVLIFGPGKIHFKDFVEGVRLVIGEDVLIAVPSDAVLSSESKIANTWIVLAFQLPETRISIASTNINSQEILRGSTSLITQYRKLRGNMLREFPHHGSIVFSHHLSDARQRIAKTLSADFGLDNWIIGVASQADQTVPIYCGNSTTIRGLIGLEILSRRPWGVGSVAMEAFKTQSDVTREAIKTALREATAQLQNNVPCFGFIFFLSHHNHTVPVRFETLKEISTQMSGLPLIAVSTENQFVRRPNRSIPNDGDSILVMVVPS